MTKKATTKTQTTGAPILIFGLDQNGKPRGAKFPAEQFDAATQAAVSLDFRIHEAQRPDLTVFLKKLPAGRIYARGKAFLPSISRDLYDNLILATTGAPAYALPRNFDELSAGQMVLANDEGWWECIIVEREADILTLRWRDYPKADPFKTHIASVAIVNPGPVPVGEI